MRYAYRWRKTKEIKDMRKAMRQIYKRSYYMAQMREDLLNSKLYAYDEKRLYGFPERIKNDPKKSAIYDKSFKRAKKRINNNRIRLI